MLLCLLFTLSTSNLFTRLLVYSSTFSLFCHFIFLPLIFYLSLHCLLKNNILLIKNQRIIFKSSLMKKIITLLVSVIVGNIIICYPAMRMWRSFKQADGTILKVMTVGDEHFNYALTEDNIPCVVP